MSRAPAGRADFLDLARPEIGEDAIAEAVDSLRSGWLVAGPKVRRFEAALGRQIGAPHVRCVSAGTAALLLGLKVSGVARGDRVIVPTLTFAACANVVEQLGAEPVLVDSDPATGLIDLDRAEGELAAGDVRALMGVHLGGRPLALDRLNGLRDRYGIAIVEDAAHAIGAAWGGRPVGSHGNVTAFSFHATKNITTIEGGALAAPDLDTAERVGRLALHGLTRSAWDRHDSGRPAGYELEEPGFKLTMTDVAASIGLHQIDKLDGWNARRAALSARYDQLLCDLDLEREPPLPAHARHAHHLYSVRLPADVDRARVIQRLRERRIGTSVHFKPLHRFSFYADRYGLGDADFPAAADYADRTLSLPLFPAMTDRDQADVATGLRAAVRARTAAPGHGEPSGQSLHPAGAAP